MPRGDNRRGSGNDRKGALSQRELIKVLKPLCDVAMSKSASKSRDDARRLIRETLLVANWRTPFVYHNLAERRCRFLTRLGYVIPSKWLLRLTTDADMKAWAAKNDPRT